MNRANNFDESFTAQDMKGGHICALEWQGRKTPFRFDGAINIEDL